MFLMAGGVTASRDWQKGEMRRAQPSMLVRACTRAPSYVTATVLALVCASTTTTALPRAQRGDEMELAGRLDRLERGDAVAGAVRRVDRLHDLVHSGHGQLMHWFKDLVPLVDCGGQQSCMPEALASISTS